MSATLQRLADEAALRRTADLYALGADTCDKALWAQVLAEDCLIESPGYPMQGREKCLAALDMLKGMFRATMHSIHQQVATIDGDRAEGVTYCTANHIFNDRDAVLAWSMRYFDTWQREGDGAWRFTHRKLVVDWEETRPVTFENGGGKGR